PPAGFARGVSGTGCCARVSAPVLVGAQRIQSGAHYPADVASGVAIGLAGAALVRAAPRLLRRALL
ncbi:phosphatase PAP2 family protein, partial [Streptomyces bottropensis]|uniref:phosphatase PAP2 family protein n=1 Tax=Streptomyces bottropensis TaxID=42235 RepID=UPI003686A81F